ncbi:hypothetical protein HW560_21405 [Paenibacillus sp. E222]|uniref:hypothetical protein n=1 Tax=Paenibacillus sp. E222 TaxID=2748863 RepID=UPI0015C6652B|nr:hypothetical protein [Paenibacillus sp. E222]QLG40413.1 hypothetical protein HW560_21405 [Paenibacillus sp. E222]
MLNGTQATAKKPATVTFVQVLMYLAAAVNIVNGMYSLGSEGTVKKLLCLAMIVVGSASIWVGARLNDRHPSRRSYAISLSIVIIMLRLIEFAILQNIGFLIGVILPVVIIWRLSSLEAKKWFGLT